MMRAIRLAFIAAAAGTALQACSAPPPPADAGLVARAGEQVWSGEAAASLLAEKPDLPADREVVRTLAELWIDYTLLASAAQQDTTLAQVHVYPLVQDLVNEQLILELRDSVITLEPLTDRELRERYRAEAPGSLVRARHIFLAWPENATPLQRDSVLLAMNELRRRIVEGGEDFAALARVHSQDAAAAQAGEAAPVFARGRMVAPVEEAAFALEPGGVSEPIPAPSGVYLVKVEDRPTPTVEQFRDDLLARRAAAAESTYVASLEAQAELQLVGDAVQRVRELARNYRSPLPEREVTRPLMVYRGGSVTQGELLWYLQAQAPSLRAQVADAPDDEVPLRVVRGVAHRELLALAARSRGWAIPPERQEEAAAAARSNLVAAARQLGLLPVEAAPDELPADAVARSVDGLMSGMLTGTVREVTPLGPMSYLLRQGTGSGVVEAGLDEVVARMRSQREGAGPPS
ncbi:MAG: hypothetical protein FIA95_11395 [Gemmatimonadetes bacterium]|nr:hypothetical protein [Gemmatimonadota bacterium]